MCALKVQMLHAIRENPFLPRAKELRDKPAVYRVWLAKKWRIVYAVEGDPPHILVLRVRPKENIDYRGL
jgi:hypothetical protein